MHVLVTGATGVLGQHVVDIARGRGHDVTAASRSLGIDITKPLDVATDATIHCATDLMRAKKVELAPIEHLPGRIVYPGIAGADHIRFPYYALKMQAEAALAGRGDHAIIRLTQFHEFAERIAALPVPMVPRHFATQSIAAVEAAAVLVDAAEGDGQGLLDEVGGPGIHALRDQVRDALRATGRRRPVLSPWMPGSRDFKAGHNLHAKHVGTITWQDHLAHITARADALAEATP